MKERSFRTFIIIWAGQFVSLIGSGLTGFALGVWVYLTTGSVTKLSFIMLSTVIPGIIMSPVAGVLVDRWNRRKAMIFSDAGAALSTLAIAVLLYSSRLEIWHMYVFISIGSAFGSFQWPAYSAATTLLVPKNHLGRAAGMVQTAEAASVIVSPAVAGVLIMTIQIWGVIAIDFATFLIALATLAVVKIPNPPPTGYTEENPSFRKEVTFGWRYIAERRGLFALLVFFALSNFVYGFVNVLFTPLVLSFTTPVMLGTVVSIGGIGMLLGGIVMSAWGGPRRRVNGILGASLVSGAALAVGGLRASVPLLAGALFLLFFTGPVANACSQAIWQTKTAPDVQGKVFAVRRMIALSVSPLSYLTAGPLADNVFEPLLAVNGGLAGTVGKILGVGPGRGIGFMVVLMGILSAVIVVGAYLYPRLRLVEDELPDLVGESTP
ncbi:MAG: MFS transporter [Theionarchaea archaeon]|nr:MFS transporter [Theionarchaea archaeon]MBU6999994.1 MFS transporter [Theionarchaea archaeon]MBU7022390.1 MFS transporter [Theionarchaea archaeon]MBU7035077.1 MFS transporter [Theionarchaea archaeon]MBU7040675.1 MFS transporter [Theionarchaea archaeon]